MIRNLAVSSTVYARGVQLYRIGAVKGVSVQRTTGQLRISVMDGYEYTVTLEETPETEIVYSCNCAAAVKEKGACRHVVAGLFTVLKHQEHD